MRCFQSPMAVDIRYERKWTIWALGQVPKFAILGRLCCRSGWEDKQSPDFANLDRLSLGKSFKRWDKHNCSDWAQKKCCEWHCKKNEAIWYGGHLSMDAILACLCRKSVVFWYSGRLTRKSVVMVDSCGKVQWFVMVDSYGKCVVFWYGGQLWEKCSVLIWWTLAYGRNFGLSG